MSQHRNSRSLQEEILKRALTEVSSLHPAFGDIAARVYNFPGDYVPFKTLVVNIAAAYLTFLGARERRDAETLKAVRNIVYVADRGLQFGMPLYAVSKTISDALHNSDPPETFRFDPLCRMGFPSMLFAVPKGSFPVASGTDFVSYIGFSWVNNEIDDPFGGSSLMTFADNGVIGFALTENFVTYDFHQPAEDGVVDFSRMQVTHSVEESTMEEIEGITGKHAVKPSREEEWDAIRRISSFAAQLALVLSSRQDLVSFGDGDGGPAGDGKLKRTKKGKEIWVPRIIGAGYKAKTSSTPSGPSGTREGSSPKTHWRRGHWRDQPYGPGRSKTKTLWMEPVLVNP